MGYAAAIYISEMHEDNNNITEILSSTRFREEAFVSEHFDREKNDHIGIPVKEKTLLITDIDPKTIVFNEIEQSGAIQKKNESYTYTKEVFFKSDDRFCVFCVILPTNYYPSKFLREKPHFAECINGKVRITWWFKSETKIQFEFKYDQDKANNFQYDDGPNLTEKYPIVKKFEEKIQDVMTDIVAKVLTKSNNE